MPLTHPRSNPPTREEILLDDFAGLAMSALISRGIMASIGVAMGLDPTQPDTVLRINKVACQGAYKIAQCMLEVRKEQ